LNPRYHHTSLFGGRFRPRTGMIQIQYFHDRLPSDTQARGTAFPNPTRPILPVRIARQPVWSSRPPAPHSNISANPSGPRHPRTRSATTGKEPAQDFPSSSRNSVAKHSGHAPIRNAPRALCEFRSICGLLQVGALTRYHRWGLLRSQDTPTLCLGPHQSGTNWL